MKAKKFLACFLAVILAVLVVSCGTTGQEEPSGTPATSAPVETVSPSPAPVDPEVTPTPEPTETPAVTPEPSETPEPTPSVAPTPTSEPTPTPTPTPTPDPEPDESKEPEQTGTDYILNTNTKKFHYPGCSSVNRMNEKNKGYYTGTRDELISNGYSPCGNCNP